MLGPKGDTNISRPATLQERQIWMVKKKNLNMISRISSSPSPLSHILLVANENIHQEEIKALIHDIEVKVYPQFRKKTTHSLQVKGLYHRAGTDHLKRLKIKNQLRKCLKRTTVTAGSGSSLWRVWKHDCQEKFWKCMLQMRPFWAILHPFISFFSPLKIQNFSRLW